MGESRQVFELVNETTGRATKSNGIPSICENGEN